MELMNFTNPSYNSPNFYIFSYTLPAEIIERFIRLDALDIITITFILLCIVVGIRWFIVNKLLKKRHFKRDIDLQGEAVAEEAVNNISDTEDIYFVDEKAERHSMAIEAFNTTKGYAKKALEKLPANLKQIDANGKIIEAKEKIIEAKEKVKGIFTPHTSSNEL